MNYWFFRRATDAERGQTMYYFRAMEPDFTALPVWNALSEMMASPPAVVDGLFQEDHWALEYSGSWQTIQDPDAVQGAYRLGQEGDELHFTFDGTDLQLVLREGAQVDRLAVTVDGRISKIGRLRTAPYTTAPAVGRGPGPIGRAPRGDGAGLWRAGGVRRPGWCRVGCSRGPC